MPALSIGNLAAWILQVTTVVVAAAAVARAAGVQPASLRFGWWRAVLVLCLLLPLLQQWREPAPSLAAAPLIDDWTLSSVAGPGSAGERTMPGALPFGLARRNDAAILGFALALGAALRLAWLTAGLFRLRQLRRAGTPAALEDTELQTLTQGGVDIRYVDTVGQPVTFGIRRPVVLLPSLLRDQPPLVQRAVLAHELLHVRRRDWAWVVCEEILRAGLWFHPAIWWVISRVQSSREEVVDELTVRLTRARRSYVEALLVFAEEPPLFPAAPFARRRHLLTRMLLISQEAAMSSGRIIASCVGMLTVLILAGWSGAAAFPLMAAAPAGDPQAQSSQARDPRPGEVRPATARELQLQKMIAAGTAGADTFVALARLQEERKAVTEAERTLLALRTWQPGQIGPYGALAAHYRRTGQFDKAVAALEEMAALDPSDPKGHHTVATFYWERVSQDNTLATAERMAYIRKGLTATDRALAAQPDFVDALIYKNLLLRLQAISEPDPRTQQALMLEADTLRAQARQMRAPATGVAAHGAGSPAPPPPPPPPPPPSYGKQETTLLNGKAVVKVGGGIAPPIKVHDVRPVYPLIAQAAHVAGLVIIEAVVDEAGGVASAQVLRSIPLLDNAALDAVRQWRYAPTTLNGVPVPVMLTVTVNFTGDFATEGVATMVPPPPPPPPPSSNTADPPALVNGKAPVRVVAGINLPTKIHDVRPAYPEVAQAAGVTGVVVLQVVLDEAGSVVDARVLRSIALLDAAALDAVRQWKYTATVVHGEAVPAILTVTVNFTL